MKREEILALVDRAMSLRDIPNIGHQMIPALCNTIQKMIDEKDQIERSTLVDVLELLGCGREPYEGDAYNAVRLTTAIVGHARGLKERVDNLDAQLTNITREICDQICETTGEDSLRRYIEERRARERKT